MTALLVLAAGNFTLNAKIFFLYFLVSAEILVRPLVNHSSTVNDVMTISEPQCHENILLDLEQRHPLTLQPINGIRDFFDNDRRQTFGRFIKKNELRVADQASFDCKHLLIAAAQQRSSVLLALFEFRKKLPDPA